MARPLTTIAVSVALLAIPLGYLYNSWLPVIQRVIVVVGVNRHAEAFKATNADDLVLIDNTVHCEDIHYYEPTNELYTACEDSHLTRFSWFPPLAEFNASVLDRARGGLFIIDTETKRSRKLRLENFSGPFSTHGIDVIMDPRAGPTRAVYIFAVNHLPNPEYFDETSYAVKTPSAGDLRQHAKARSQIEIFRHEIGSSTARHVRSVRDPLLIRTPNDIVALSPMRFLVTNDHYYREGFMRQVEDLYPGATWTDTVDVSISDLATKDPAAGLKVTVAVKGIHNNNGLGRGRTADELIITSAVGGSLHFVQTETAEAGQSYKVLDEILLDSAIDNPSYFRDPYATSDFDASGFILAGLARGIDLSETHADPTGKDPVLVWHVKNIGGKWEKKVIWQDDSSTLRSASAAVLVAIDPVKEGGKRRAWLYATGFISSNVVAVKVDL